MTIEELNDEVSKIVSQVNQKLVPLSAFEFGDFGIGTDITFEPVPADNQFGMSAIQVWKLVETYQVNEDGSLSKREIK